MPVEVRVTCGACLGSGTIYVPDSYQAPFSPGDPITPGRSQPSGERFADFVEQITARIFPLTTLDRIGERVRESKFSRVFALLGAIAPLVVFPGTRENIEFAVFASIFGGILGWSILPGIGVSISFGPRLAVGLLLPLIVCFVIFFLIALFVRIVG